MPGNRPLFTTERIAVLAVCILAISAILYFATRPAPAVHHIVTPATDTVTTDTTEAKTAVPDTVIVLDKARKRPNRNRPSRSRIPAKPRQPVARDYGLTPESERSM